MKRLVFLLMFASLNCFAQYETGTHVFWQPNVKLSFDMFQGQPSDSTIEKIKKANIYHSIALGLWGELDVPATKRGWKKMSEKVYFCAAMDKTQSYLIVRDSTELKYAQLLWDICELASRIARRNLENVKNELYEGKKGTGGVAIMYKTCHNDGKEFGKGVTDGIFDEVIAVRDEDAYQKYRKQIDSLLINTEQFATTKEEIERFIRNTPDEGYIKPASIMDDLKHRGTIRY